jgi:pimeloyl-ACP methyl ester carboxylesterase
MQTLEIALDDTTLVVDVGGPTKGPLALCLHGFPDTRFTWRYLMPHLAERGWRVAAPNLRGYAPSTVATSGNYRVAALADDAIALHDRLEGDENALLIGHDWGASATYAAINGAPERWSKAVTFAVPPLSAMAGGLSNYEQLRRIWYMFFFQSPLADFTVPVDDYAFIKGLWRDWSPGYDGHLDADHVIKALTNPENLSAALGYYRAMFGNSVVAEETKHDYIQANIANIPSQPVLYLHGENDGCLAKSAISNPLDFLSPTSKMVYVKNAGHFLHLEQPTEIHEHIDSFLGE